MASALSGGLGPAPRRATVLLTFATVSWQKGSAAQVASLVHELRRIRDDLRFQLLSHCPEIDAGPAGALGIDVIDPGFPPEASRNRRSVSMLRRRIACMANGHIHRSAAWWRVGARERLAEAYAGADMILDLSGDSYRDPPGGFALAHHATFLAALAMETPYSLVSQSLGPFHPWNRPLARYCLNRARLVYIRERRTREILVGLGVRPEKVQLAPDVAFALPALPARNVWSEEGLARDRIPRPWVALSVSDLALRLAADGKENSYLDELAHLSEHVHRQHGGSLLLVPHEINPPYYGSDDRSAADRLLERMGRPTWMHSIRGDYDPSRLKGFISECDALVASRMHAAIAGLSSGVPTLLVAWSHKYAGVMEEIDLDGCVWDQHAPAGSLVSHFERLWRRRDAVRRHLLDYTARARREVAAMTERIAACIPGAIPRPMAGCGIRDGDVDPFRALSISSPPVEVPDPRASEPPLPRVSIVMPVYNEAVWIQTSLEAVLRQDYPPHLVEVLIADSGSDDGTVDRIRGTMARYPDHRVRLLENSRRTPGAALNLMIRQAEGDIIVRVDGHAEVAPDYVRRCVALLQNDDALNVGGCVSASGHNLVGKAVAIAIGSFWGNGGARYRSRPPSGPTYVDTVQFGAWRRETLARLGPFIEHWTANEDCEFNARILDAGGRILMDPAIRATYFPRHSLRSLARQYFRYGKLKCGVIARHPRQLRARQVAPPLLVLSLLAPLPFAMAGEDSLSLLLLAPLGYFSAIGIASVQIALRSGQPFFACVLPAVLATLHLSYGIGAWLGMAKMLIPRRTARIPAREALADSPLGLRAQEPETGKPEPASGF